MTEEPNQEDRSSVQRSKRGLSEAGGIVLGAVIASAVTVLSTWMSNAAEEKRDRQARFRDERRQAYVAFLQEGRKLLEMDERLGKDHWAKSDDSARVVLEEITQKFAATEDEVSLLAGDNVKQRAFEAVALCNRVGDASQPPPGKGQIPVTPEASRNRCWRAIWTFQEAARKELRSPDSGG